MATYGRRTRGNSKVPSYTPLEWVMVKARNRYHLTADEKRLLNFGKK